MTTDYKLPARSSNLYVTGQTYRWLQWLALMEEGVMASPDAVAEFILRRAILAECPGIEQAEAKWQYGKKKLQEEAKELLKSGHAKLDEGTGAKP